MRSLTNYLTEALVNKKVSNEPFKVNFDANIVYATNDEPWTKETLEELASKLTSEEKDELSGISVNDNWRVKFGKDYNKYFLELDFKDKLSLQDARKYVYNFIKKHFPDHYATIFKYRNHHGAGDDVLRKALCTFAPDSLTKTDKILIALDPYCKFTII